MKQSQDQISNRLSDIPITLDKPSNTHRLPRYKLPQKNRLRTQGDEIDHFPLSKVKQDFYNECLKYGVELFYVETVTRAIEGRSQQEQLELLADEIEMVREGESDYHLIREAFQERRLYIQDLMDRLRRYQHKYSLKSDKLRTCCSLLTTIRISTILLIEKVASWKYKLSQLHKRPAVMAPEFKHQGINIFQILQKDLLFLPNTLLSRYIEFSQESDPLLIQPYYSMLNNPSSKMYKYQSVVDLFRLDNNMKMRMHQASGLLQEDRELGERRRKRGKSGMEVERKPEARELVSVSAAAAPKGRTTTVKQPTKPKRMISIAVNTDQYSPPPNDANKFLRNKERQSVSLPNIASIQQAQTQKTPKRQFRSSKYWGNINRFPRMRLVKSHIGNVQSVDSRSSVYDRETIFEGRRIKIKSEQLMRKTGSFQISNQSTQKVSSYTQVKTVEITPKPPLVEPKVQEPPIPQVKLIFPKKEAPVEQINKTAVTVQKQQKPSPSPKAIEQPAPKQPLITKPPTPIKQPSIAPIRDPLIAPTPRIQSSIAKSATPIKQPVSAKQSARAPQPAGTRQPALKKELATPKSSAPIQQTKVIEEVNANADNTRARRKSITKSNPKIVQFKPPSLSSSINKPQTEQTFIKPIKVPQEIQKTQQLQKKEIKNKIPDKITPSGDHTPLYQPQPRYQKIQQQKKSKIAEQKIAPSQPQKKQSSSSQFDIVQKIFSMKNNTTKMPLVLGQDKSKPPAFILNCHNLKLSDFRPFILSLVQNMSQTQSMITKQLLLNDPRYFSHTYLHEIKQHDKTIFFAVWCISKSLRSRTLNLIFLKVFNYPQTAALEKLIKVYLNGIQKLDPCESICYIQHKLDNNTEIPKILRNLTFKQAPNEEALPHQKSVYLQLERTNIKCMNVEQEQSILAFQLSNLIIQYSKFNYFYSNEIEKFHSSNYFDDQIIYELVKFTAEQDSLLLNNSNQQKLYTQIKQIIKNSYGMNIKVKTSFYQNIQDCNEYLKEVLLDPYPTTSNLKDISLCIGRIYDSLPIEYLVNNGCILFKTDNMNSFYGESMTFRFCLIKISKKTGDIYIAFIKNISPVPLNPNRSLKQLILYFTQNILNTYAFKKTSPVCIRFFKKHLYGRIRDLDNSYSVYGNLSITFNWVDFLTGIKYYDSEQPPIPFVSDMIFAIYSRSEDGKFRPLIGTTIKDRDFLNT